MHLDSLKCLIAIEQAGSIRKASNILITSYQNTSKILKQLEEELGVIIFERTPKGMVITEKGKPVLAFAKATLESYYALKALYNTKEQFSMLSGNLNITTSPLANLCYLNDLLLDFAKQHPKIQTSVLELDKFSVMPPSTEKTAKLCFFPQSSISSADANTQVIPLLSDKVIMLAQKDSPLGRQKSISLKAMAQQPLIIVAQNNLQDSSFFHFIKPFSDKVKASFVTGNSNCYKYIAQGLFVGASTAKAYGKIPPEDKERIAAVPIRAKTTNIWHCLIIRNPEGLTPIEKHFVTFVKDYFHIG